MAAAEAEITALKAEITAIKTKITNTGESLSFICKSIDTSSNACCVNQADNKLFCASESFADIVGITEVSSAGTCGPATDGACV